MRKKKHGIRGLVQTLATLLTNANFKGFLQGTISKGKLKTICVPGMNCYSCPGAVGACPIGAMQAVLNARKYNFAFYIVGFLCALGVLFGRLICGWLCVFGFLEDLLYKIPTPKLKIPQKVDKRLRFLKYIVLIVFVIGLPTFLVNEYGTSAPYFCKLICPVGTLEGGIPLVLLNESLRKTVGFLFHWKLGILILIVLSSVFIYRPFCKYICPLGAFYSLFNKVSFVKIGLDKEKCTGCGLCSKKCKMGVDVRKDANSRECIRCGDCVHACPCNALKMGVRIAPGVVEKQKNHEDTLSKNI